jgi:putative oxidoreductase
MSDSISITAHPTAPARWNRNASIALWSAQVVLAAMFLLAGVSKLASAPAMVGLFDAIGLGQWFRYVTGLTEVISAVALLMPSFAAFGAVALAATMVGAIAAHLFIVGGSPVLPALLLLGSIVIAWARRDRLRRLVKHALSGVRETTIRKWEVRTT